MYHALLILLAAAALIAPALAQSADTQVDYSRITKDTTIRDEDVNLNAMRANGFGDVADIYEQMTPEQRAAVLQAASERQKELEKMSPAERRKLEADLHKTAKMLDQNMGLENVDPAKLDPSKAKDLDGTMQDVHTYQKLEKSPKK